jgi:hypothetical protein
LRTAAKSSPQRGPWSVRIAATLFAVFLATAGLSRAQVSVPGPQPEDKQSTVRGTVVNAMTGAPISRALVYSADNRLATFTDGEGHFEFDLPKVGNGSERSFIDHSPYNGGLRGLMARKPGFLDDANVRRQAETTSGSDLTITIPLLPEALIKGRVIQSEADPALGISVQLFSRRVQDGMPKWVQTDTARANSSGEFRFAELVPGTYKLLTNESMDNDPAITVPGGQQYGFAPVYYPGVADFAAAGVIQLTAGQTVQVDIPLTRQPYLPVRIPVASGELNGNMRVTVSVQGHRGPGYSLGYIAEKRRIEGLLPNGNYLVEATTYGQSSASGAAHLVVAGAPAEAPTMTLVRNSSITVHVIEQFSATDWNGKMTWGGGGGSFEVHGPRGYLQINAESADDFGQQGAWLRPPSGPTDDSLVLENLMPGRYWLQLHSSRGYVAAATVGGVDLLHEPLVVGPGSSIPIEVTMRDDNAELDGTVAGLAPPASTDSSGDLSQRQAWVYCVPLPDSPGQFEQTWVSPEGKINSTQMAPGTYRILAFASQQPNLSYRDAEAMKLYDTKGQVVHLAAGEKASVQLQLIPSIE